MDRRSFLRGAAAAGVGATMLKGRAAESPPASQPRETNRPDDSDRSSNRDPLALQKSTLVVEGLVAGGPRLSHLELQKKGGVDCGVTGLPEDPLSFAKTLKFFDEHKKEYVVARSVAEIRKAKQDGKITVVYGWQSAENLGAAFNSPLGTPDTPL